MTTTAFNARDLVRSEGTGDRAQDIIEAVKATYPPELQAAQMRQENADLTAALTDDDFAHVLEVLGDVIPEDEKPRLRLKVRGEFASDAVVTYVFVGDDGDTHKGVIPYTSLLGRSDDGHVRQWEELGRSSVAQRLASEIEIEQAAKLDGNPEVLRLRKELEEANAKLAATQAPQRPAPPFAAYDETKATDIASALATEDSIDRLDHVIAYEESAERPRKTIVNAATARREALAQAEREAAAAKDREIEQLRQTVAQLQAAQGGDAAGE